MPSKKKNTPTGQAAGYVRVSTRKQQMSPAAQEEKIRALANLQDLPLQGVYTDRESAKEGSMRSRPALVEILELARIGAVNRIIIAKLDRLTRSVVDLGELLTVLDKANVSLVSATESWMDTGSAAGRMIINIITSVAQWEREALAERTTEVLQYKREHGLVYGLPPYGFRPMGRGRLEADGSRKKYAGMKLVPIPAEQAVIRRMKQLRGKGWTLRKIAEQLNRDKVPTKKRGGHWHVSTVANVLRLAG
jgi:DNA invertase Pin-like site-specific DNA recombinase